MSGWLEGSFAKLRRGEEHMDAYVASRISIFAQPNPPVAGMSQYADFQRSDWVVKIARVPELPPRFGLLIGDAIHNFRSALDQAVFELAFVDNGGKELDKTAFPSSADADNFNSSYVQNTLLEGLTDPHKALIEGLLPYKGWEGTGPHPLSLLGDLSNDDKHRLIQPVLITPMEVEFAIPEVGRHCTIPTFSPQGTMFVGRPLEKGTEILRFPIRITGPKPDVDVQVYAGVQVGFRNGLDAEGVLRAIATHTRRALDAIAPEFGTPEAHALRHLPRWGRMRDVDPDTPVTFEFAYAPGRPFPSKPRPPSTEKG